MRFSYRVEFEENENIKKQYTSLCVILSVTIVEVFMNVYFRVLILEDQYKHAEKEILDDLNIEVPLDKKINNWSNLVFEEKIYFGSGAAQKFSMLKKLRNSLVHFSSAHETSEYSCIIINGMTDTSAYKSLSKVLLKEIMKIAFTQYLKCEGWRKTISAIRHTHGQEKYHIYELINSFSVVFGKFTIFVSVKNSRP